MSAHSSQRALYTDDERPYRPSSSHTSHSLKSSPRDSLSRAQPTSQSHSAKNKSSYQAADRSPSPPQSRLRTFSSSATASPPRTTSLASSSAHPPSQFASSSSAATAPSSHPLLSDSELHDLLSAFQVFDRDGAGRVPTNLILATLRSLPPHPSHALLSSLLTSPNDRGHGGTVTFNEFVSLLTAGVSAGGAADAAGRAEWERLFALMDEGGKGWLDESDMERVRRMVGGGKAGASAGGKSEVRAMLVRADLNGDGVVSRDEFVALMMENRVV